MIIEHPGSSSIPSLIAGEKPPLSFTGRKALSVPAKAQGRGQRILVIDDEVRIADSLVEILMEHGYSASAFYDGPSAIASAREACPDVVISDVVMPEVNGVDTVMAIREVCSRVRILLFSGQASTADLMKEARAKGHLFEVLPKPIHPDELLKRLAEKLR